MLTANGDYLMPSEIKSSGMHGKAEVPRCGGAAARYVSVHVSSDHVHVHAGGGG